MQYTRETIKSLHEDRLQRDVLVPLFRAMGFRDVTLYHGGVREQGKDIIMWKYDELGLRQNWAAVVKATKITGEATGRGSAGEVCTQVRQAFADPFKDPKSGTERIVSRCFVVSSKTIKKDSIVSIQNILKGTPAERATQFINGETLWDLIEEHLPKSAIWERFTAAQEDMNSGLILLNEDIEGTIGYPSEIWKDFLNAAVEIQEKTEKPLALPDRDITGEEVQAVLELSGRLERGHTEFTADTVRLEMNREGLGNLLKEFDKAGEVKDLTIRQIEEVEILDTTVPLGDVVYVFSAKLSEREAKKIRRFLNKSDGESLEVTIDVSASSVKVLYLTWYEEGAEISERLNMALES